MFKKDSAEMGQMYQKGSKEVQICTSPNSCPKIVQTQSCTEQMLLGQNYSSTCGT